MSDRQIFLDQVRELINGLNKEVEKPRVKEVETFCVKEALFLLEAAKTHINSYLQVDKERGK
ncbi:MAG: hypothetical protein VX982_06280 [Chloroflexota bacterium]|nr:hypothetical protein [Chloroflexota bacterium]